MSEPGGVCAAVWTADLRPWRVALGPGLLESLGEEALRLGGDRALLVTDPGIAAAGHVERARESLERAGVVTAIYDRVGANPTETQVAAAADLARAHRADLIVGLGGGSPMDCAKGANFVYTNGGSMEDYWGWGKAEQPLLPSIGVPCTAGTGSEAQSYALISRDRDHRKMACGDEQARFRLVILDPGLLHTAPRGVIATAGMDALSHALESYATRVRNPFSEVLAREAWRRLECCYAKVIGGAAHGDEAWDEMLIGAHLAGAAIEVSMLGAAHACANPLTARYDVVHGVALGIMLPPVLRLNGAVVGELYARLVGGEPAAAGSALARRIEAWREMGALPGRLRDLGIPESALGELAALAAQQWTAGFNPRPLSEADLSRLYEAAY